MIRRTFSEFVEFNNIDLYGDAAIFEGNFISKISNWLGKKGQDITSAVNDLKHFPKKVRLAYGGMNANLINDDETLPEDTRKQIANTINDKKPGKEQIEYIKSVWKEHGSENDYKNSGFMVYALLYGKELAQNLKDEDSVTFFDRGIKSISNDTIKNAKKVRDEEANKSTSNNEKNDDTENTKKDENTNVTVSDNGEDKKQEEVKSDIESKVSTDPLAELTKTSGLDSKKLKDAITYLVYNDNKDKSTEDFDNMVTALGAIICGAKILGDDDKLSNDILKGWGIESIKVLVDEVLKEV